jgi:PAS domain S-box-containing protein
MPTVTKCEETAAGSALLQAVLDAADHAIFSVDRDYCYTSYNARHAADMKEVFGATIALGGSMLNGIGDPDLQARARHSIGRALSGEQFTDEADVRGPGPQSYWFETDISALRNVAGAVIGAAVIVRDVTDQRVAEQALEREASRYRTLLGTTIDGVHVLDAAGRVVEANGAFCRMLGRTPDEVLRLHVTDWDIQFAREDIPNMIAVLLDRSETFATRHRRSDGTEYAAEISATGIRIGDETLLYCVARDISTRRQVRPGVIPRAGTDRAPIGS